MNTEIKCSTCGSEMIIQKRIRDGKEFLGCSRWPDCDFTEPLPAYLEMKRMGAQTLPGME